METRRKPWKPYSRCPRTTSRPSSRPTRNAGEPGYIRAMQARPTVTLALPRLRRLTIGLVPEDNATGLQRPRFQKRHLDPVRAGLEQGIPTAQDEGSQGQINFIKQPTGQERRGEVRAPKDEEVLAGLLLQFGDLVLGFLFHEPRIVPFGLLERLGKDDFRDRIHEIGDLSFLGRPIPGHSFVRYPAEQQHPG